jgi:hypothetical protein
MDYASPVLSNLKRATISVDDELSVSAEAAAMVDAMPVSNFSPTEEQVEQLIRGYELNYAASSGSRWKGQERWMGKENEEMRLVNILHPHQVFAKLRRAGVDARIESPGDYIFVPDPQTGVLKPRRRAVSNGRLWLHDEVRNGRVGISAWFRDPNTGLRKRRMVTSLQYPYGPEWSLMRFDEYDVPTVERYRGWRTALLALLMDKVLTEEEVDRAFGPVVLNEASALYRQTIQQHRRIWRGLASCDLT